jgi:hypothetical protein
MAALAACERGLADASRQPARQASALGRTLEHDPEKLADFSDKIMRQNKDVDVAHDST